MNESAPVAEQSVLGAILLTDKVLKTLVLDEGLRAGHFNQLRHQETFAAMLALAQQGEPIDVVTLTGQLERTGKLDAAGGADAIDTLAGTVPNVGNLRAYARRVMELARWRSVRSAGYLLVEASETQSPDCLAKAEALMVPEGPRERTMTVAEEVYHYLDETDPLVWPLPFGRLNELSGGGLFPSEQTLIGGWTSVGKTVLLDSILQHLTDRGVVVRLYINEGSKVQRALRMIARDTGVPYSRLRSRKLGLGDHKTVVAALAKGLPVEIVQAADWSAADIARDMRWNPREVVAVDILHEIDYTDERGLAANWSTLKAASTVSGCHLLATVHLNETRAVSGFPPAPTLRDIRGSGMLKNGADNVLFVHREHEETEGHLEMTDVGAVWWAKSRSSALGGVPVRFDADRMRFVQREREEMAV